MGLESGLQTKRQTIADAVLSNSRICKSLLDYSKKTPTQVYQFFKKSDWSILTIYNFFFKFKSNSS